MTLEANNPDKINLRIDRILALFKDSRHPAYVLIDRVYRPFCHEMIRLERDGQDVHQVVEGCIALLANMVSELARSTSDKPERWAVGIMKAVKQYNKQQDWKTPETDALIKKRMN